MTACPVCLGDDVIPFVRRDRVPVTQNLIVAAYDDTQSHSPWFKAYVDKLARMITEERGVQNARIVEVGCGKGYFRLRLVDNAASSTGWGFHPSYVGPESDLGGSLHFERRYYGPGWKTLRADVVVCRHVIEHVADPVALLATVRAALGGSRCARVFFESRRSRGLWIERWRNRVRSAQKLAIWGAGAKGVTFASVGDPECELIDRVVDLNPHKQNHFAPGTTT